MPEAIDPLDDGDMVSAMTDEAYVVAGAGESWANTPVSGFTIVMQPPGDIPDDQPMGAIRMRGIELLLQERVRQVTKKGYTPEHDAEHIDGEIYKAAMAYLKAVHHPVKYEYGNTPPDNWPWGEEYWNPSRDPLRNLVKAGALIVAEIDRIVAQIESEEQAHELGG